jgi:tetratricopeptide (TPR) repeat protein
MKTRRASAGVSAIALAALLPAAALPATALAQQAQPAAPQPGAPQQAAPQPSTSASDGSAALNVLLRQARYWMGQSNNTRAIEAAQRALRLDPNNAEALALIAQVQANSGQETEAQQTLDMLEKAHPDASQIGQVQQAIRVGAISPAALENARQLAQQGDAQQAVQAYQSLFGGGKPPDSVGRILPDPGRHPFRICQFTAGSRECYAARPQ